MSLRHNETDATALADDLELFRYVYRPGDAQLESPRPFFHPVRTLRGDLVTIYRPHDHVWHKGIALSLPQVGTDNFWGGPTFRNGAYVQVHNDGAMRHDGFDVAVAKDDVVRLDERLTWVTEAGQTPVTERRRIAATVLPSADPGAAWLLAFETTLVNVSGAQIVIGSPTTAGRPNAGYGGLFWRGPRSFTGGTVVTPDGTGGDELMGTHAPWLAFAGQHDEHGRSSTLVFRDSRELQLPDPVVRAQHAIRGGVPRAVLRHGVPLFRRRGAHAALRHRGRGRLARPGRLRPARRARGGAGPASG